MFKLFFYPFLVISLLIAFLYTSFLNDVEMVSIAKVDMKQDINKFISQKQREAVALFVQKLGYEIKDDNVSPQEDIASEKPTEEVVVASKPNDGIVKPQFSHMSLPFYYDHSNAPDNVSKSQVLDMIEQASKEWTNACNISFAYKGDRLADYVDIGSNLNTKEGIIKWDELEGNSIGESHQGSESGPASGFVMLFKPSFFKHNKSVLPHTVLHELGHVIGLSHNKNPKSIMYYSTSGKEASLGEADKAMCRYFRARWQGMSSQAASDKYGVLPENSNN